MWVYLSLKTGGKNRATGSHIDSKIEYVHICKNSNGKRCVKGCDFCCLPAFKYTPVYTHMDISRYV